MLVFFVKFWGRTKWMNLKGLSSDFAKILTIGFLIISEKADVN